MEESYNIENSIQKNKTPDSPNERKGLVNKRKHKIKKRKKVYQNIRLGKNIQRKYIIAILCLILFFIIFMVIIHYFSTGNKNMNNNKGSEINFEIPKNILINKDPELEYNDCQEYMKMITKGILYDRNKLYYPTNNPKISIVLPVYNGEGLLKEAILSIQNQDFKDIEIIIIDDQSTDDSVKLIKELMKKEPRISFYQNDVNKGILYTKTKGVLIAKGKYIMILDDDDKYLQRDAFTTLYSEAEKENLDIIKFRVIQSLMFSIKGMYKSEQKEESPIIKQPELGNFLYFKRSDGNIMKHEGYLYNLIIRADLFKAVINKINDKYLNTRLNNLEDNLLFFLLTRNAKSLKQINRIFYMTVVTKFIHDPKVEYRRKEKNKDRNYLSCLDNLNFVEMLFDLTNNSFDDKRIPFSQLKIYYLYNNCKNNLELRLKGKQVCKLFLDSKYINESDKNEINVILEKMEKK